MQAFETQDPALAKELSKKVVKKLGSLVRSIVPTFEGEDGKAVHRDVAVIGNRLVFGTDMASCASDILLRTENLAKRHLKSRKDPLREALEAAPITALINYARISSWLNTNEDLLVRAAYGESGCLLSVIPGMSELRMEVTDEHRAYHQRCLSRISAHTPEGGRMSEWLGLELPKDAPDGTPIVIAVSGGEMALSDSLYDGSGIAQAKVRLGSLAGGEKGETERHVSAFKSPLGGHVIAVRTVCPSYTALQYFRALDISTDA